MSRIHKKPEIRKTEIINTAEKLFMEYGYDETSVEDILKAADLSKGGFYHHFSSKEDVLKAIINTLVDEILIEAQNIIDHTSYNAIQKLQLFLERQLVLKKPKILLTRFLAQRKKDDFLTYQFNKTIWQKYAAPVASILEQGVQEGLFNLRYPFETADILLRLISSLADYENALLEDQEKFSRYVSSLQSIIARTLGMEESYIRLLDQESVDDLFGKKE